MDKLLNSAIIKKIIYFIFGVGCITYAYSLYKFTPTSIMEVLVKFENVEILIAIGLYLLSHTIRVLRLLLLSPIMSVDIRSLWKEQYTQIHLLF